MTTFRIADLFCGAGGSSRGAIRAIEAMGAEVELTCVNHWDVAIASHRRNHPLARHFCVNLDAARPEDLVPEGALDLLMASPECTFFSRARGGKPVNDQSRMSAWHVQRWATTLDIRCILVENVAEFVTWGPLTADGKPDKARKGLYFQAWIRALADLGGAVPWLSFRGAQKCSGNAANTPERDTRKVSPRAAKSYQLGGPWCGGARLRLTWCAACERETPLAHPKSLRCGECRYPKLRRLTRRQRQVRDAIASGAIVIWTSDPEAMERWGEDPRSRPVLLHLDPEASLGLAYAEELQWRTLWPCLRLGLLTEDNVTPFREDLAS